MKKVMKNKKVMAMMVVGLVAILLAASGVVASTPMGAGDPPVESKINYQGQLTDDKGNPLNGTYDMEFRFYDSAIDGSQVGGIITKNDVTVTNGLFSVKLDVNQSGFNGQGLWLEVKVEGETLSPRQEILPVPYALSLKPGAEINGEEDFDAALSVFNRGEGNTYGIYSEAWNTGDWENCGGCFVADGSLGRGVLGYASNTGDAINYGGYFYASGVQGRGVFGKAEGDSGIGVYGSAKSAGYVENYGGWFETESNGGKGMYARNNGSGSYGYVGSSREGVYGFGTWSGVLGESMSDGVVGKNTATGTRGVLGAEDCAVRARVEGRGQIGVSAVATGLYGYAVTGRATNTEDCINYGGYFVSDGRQGVGVHAVATGTMGTGIIAKSGQNGYAADFYGNVIIRARDTADPVVELGQGLDYAEGFAVSDERGIGPGSVLIIDPNNPGKLTLSNEPYDSKVAGIVAGAKGMGSGVRLGVDQFDYDVALAGRVYCNVDATEAAVEPGDLLTTSATPGYAMKVIEYGRAQGAILGKAMEGLGKGRRGQILVLVTLQ